MNDAPLSHTQAIRAGSYLDNEEVLSLIAKYQETGCRSALGKLVINFSNLCMKMANRYRLKFAVEDTYQDCMEFLILALRKYDPSYGVPFFSFATLDISRELSRRAISKWASVTTPNSKGFFKAFRQMGRFRDCVLSQAQAVELALELDINVNDVFNAYAIFNDSTYSLQHSDFEGGVPLLESIADHDGPEKIVIEFDYATKMEATAKLRMAKLNPNETIVIELRHLAEKPKTLHEVGAKIGISAERVRQIECKAFQKLKVAA